MPAHGRHGSRWTVRQPDGEAHFTGVAKWEIRPGGGRLLSSTLFGEGVAGGEPVLCPKPGRENVSDAVWILTWVYDAHSNVSALVVLDGEVRDAALPELARLRVADGVRVPFGFHGHWMPEPELLEHVVTHSLDSHK
mmetsp:Transcript_10455/g.27146  ORF Transcript_10455/g.27146 Transcript_10455/m.27146 type:complete len:137 (+) Transcript_10455:89-499(+)|eukprot:CAMPEP_0119433240 /NCGR_PEP_ID=MMETSP1335-20130426/49284_1 /TAXON_ID=259385 /ORGANISM="Chrysoculter rhomboideus, Strain RCC1486" /LENGTH=136 /DNA_ID=CAMNT_0007459075 /DNA_START=55 /DNA_END=465 /DNA_ORIENTATION=+